MVALKVGMIGCLESLDSKWCFYEEHYITELMAIESDARRFVVSAIRYEAIITDIEAKLLHYGSSKSKQERSSYKKLEQELSEAKSNLIGNICKINSVANTQGKGRDDFTLKLLIKAEEVLTHPFDKTS